MMGASEILKILRKNNNLTSIEIAEKTKCSITSVQKALSRLLKDVSENLEVRKLSVEEKEIRYGKNIGCKINIYWLNE